MFKVCEDVRQHQSRIQEFQNRGRGLDAVKFLGSGYCFDASSHIPYDFPGPAFEHKVKVGKSFKVFKPHSKKFSVSCHEVVKLDRF